MSSTAAERQRAHRARRVAAGQCPRCPSTDIRPMRTGGKPCSRCSGVLADDLLTHRRIKTTRELLGRAARGEITLPTDLIALVKKIAQVS